MIGPDGERKATVEIGMDAARDTLTDLTDRAAIAGERFIITRNGKARAALIGMKDFTKLQESDAA